MGLFNFPIRRDIHIELIKLKLILASSILAHACTSRLSENEVTSQHKNTTSNSIQTHFRGLSIVDGQNVWASGTNGTFRHCSIADGVWIQLQIPGAEQLDFRDINAWNDNEAIVMSSGQGVYIYRTETGGAEWNMVYSDRDTNVFFDGMSFDGNRGIAYGDPIKGKFQLLRTTDAGKSWEKIQPSKLPDALEKEAGFAASGTGIFLQGDRVWFITGGGAKSRIFISKDFGNTWNAYDTPIKSGDGEGIFSLCVLDEQNLVLVGGNYRNALERNDNAAFSIDGGLNWTLSESMPLGYRSCVVASKDRNILVCTGTSGTDISEDYGKTWRELSEEGFNTCAFVGNSVLCFGSNAKYKKLDIKPMT